MIISRTLAKRRIAHNVRPGFFAAWLPVLADALCLTAVLILLWAPVMWIVGDAALPVIVGVFFIVYFIPAQVVIITSSMWATRSRWNDDPKDQLGR